VSRAPLLALFILTTPALAQTVACGSPLPSPLTLALAELRGQQCNRDLHAALQAVDAAAAGVVIAGQKPNPNLTFGTSNINPSMGIGAGGLREKTIDSSVRIDQVIERGGKAELRTEQAQRLAEAARADLADTLRQQRAALRSAFFDTAAAQQRVQLQRAFVDYARQSGEAAQRRLDAGEISRNDANRFRLDAARAANDLRQAELDLNKARVAFAAALGAEAQALAIEVKPEWPDAGTAVPDAVFTGRPPSASATVPVERADVAAARLRLAAAEAARQSARALSTRDVTVGAQADHWPTSETNLQGTGISYGFTVSIPLFVRHSYQGEMAKALAELESARVQHERVAAIARAEAQAAFEEWRATRERRERLERESAPAAREVASGAEFAYRKGASGILDLLDARRSLKGAELDELQARAEEGKAWARYQAAIETYQEPAHAE
jgi:cobalt-zinc-cadmium efflux system outer membrane protein